MPRRKTTTPQNAGGAESKRTEKEAMLEVIARFEKEHAWEEGDDIDPGSAEVFGTFVNSLKHEITKAGDSTITGEAAQDVWKKALALVARFGHFLMYEYKDATPEMRRSVAASLHEIEAAGAELFPGMNAACGVEAPTPHALMKAETYVMPTSKAAKYLTQVVPEGELSGQLRLLLYPTTSKKADIRTVIGLTYEGPGVQLRSRHKITKYDQAVHNAISSLWEAGNRSISPQEIFRTMNGNADVKVKAKQVEKVDASVNKLMFTRLTLDLSADINEGGLVIRDSRVSKGIVETQLLQATIGTLQTNNGKTVRGYILSREPMLYTYSKAKKHVLSVDASLLDTSDELSNTDDVIVIREYLLQQVENMRHGYRDNTVIDYETIAEVTGISPAEAREEQRRFRETVKKILSSWKKKGYIQGYTDHKAGRTVKGVKIILQQPAPRIEGRAGGRKE